MSLVHADNFNFYGSGSTTARDNALDGIYAQLSVGFGGGFNADPDGLSSALVMSFQGQDNCIARYALKNPTSKVGVAQRLWLNALPATSDEFIWPMSWRDAGNGLIARFQIMTTGSIQAFVMNPANNAFVLVGDTITPVVTPGGWYHIEAVFEASTGSAGTFEIRVEGVTVIDASGIDTFTDTVYQIGQYCQPTGTGHGQSHSFKDYVVWDDDGTMNNDFLGSVIVAELIPASDVTAGGWTSTGANIFGVLDNAAPNDAQYITADDTPPDFCEVTLTNLPADVTSVKGLISVVRAGKVDGGDGNLQNAIRSGGDLSEGADRPITAAQIYWTDVHELDPDTSAPWTPGAVDLATLVIDRTV